MNVFITYGTQDYLNKVKEEHSQETMVLMHKEEDQFSLLHETEGETVFNEEHAYEVLDAVGDLQEGGYTVLNNIPVSDEGRPLFEHRFNQRARLIEKEPGFAAIRVLRPLKHDTYVILTMWKDEQSFKNWQESKAYDKAHQKRGTSEGVDQQKSIFPRPSYVTNYRVVEA
ncbi:antibiotic biosynthesis monooxygenase family protein [Metabacillus iocasae]|uniref:Heme-degrading monooxygenase HmoA n=1 Tax=Priestia iocasae TaxID=2291674 RepID=A0ABS2QT80_9BACI|nr:antibiotic biosynthesis monooxygenase [Metabacillus iocasae]MBM7702671.1 heme-degrading monooxygenase HmoA [Metabacillus iocasae]